MLCVLVGFGYIIREIGSVNGNFTFIGWGEDDWACVENEFEVAVDIRFATISTICVERDSFNIPILDDNRRDVP
jgi:hypothetical protein